MGYKFYIFVFLMKLLEHTIYSLRMTFLVSGEKKVSTMLSFFEVIVWAIGTGTVVTVILDDFFVLIPFLLGGALGIYVGMFIQSLISTQNTVLIGTVNVKKLEQVMLGLKQENFGVTVLESDEEIKVLILATKQNRVNLLKKTIKKWDESATLINNGADDIVGGYVF